MPEVELVHIQKAIVGVFERMAANLKAAGTLPPPPFKMGNSPEEFDKLAAEAKASK